MVLMKSSRLMFDTAAATDAALMPGVGMKHSRR